MANPFLVNGVGSPQAIHQTSTVKHHKLGTKGQLDDGRVFYYASLAANATALVRANLQISRALLSTVTAQSTSGATLTAGATRVSLDTSGTITTGQLVDGFVSIPNAAGEGFEYKIRNHTTVSGAGVITVDLYDPLVIAGSTSTDLSIFANPYANPFITTTLGAAAGVSKVAVALDATNEQYHWLQTWGECAVLAPALVGAVGQGLLQSVITAGAICAGALVTDTIIGQARVTQISGDFQMVYLKIRP